MSWKKICSEKKKQSRMKLRRKKHNKNPLILQKQTPYCQLNEFPFKKPSNNNTPWPHLQRGGGMSGRAKRLLEDLIRSGRRLGSIPKWGKLNVYCISQFLICKEMCSFLQRQLLSNVILADMATSNKAPGQRAGTPPDYGSLTNRDWPKIWIKSYTHSEAFSKHAHNSI